MPLFWFTIQPGHQLLHGIPLLIEVDLSTIAHIRLVAYGIYCRCNDIWIKTPLMRSLDKESMKFIMTLRDMAEIANFFMMSMIFDCSPPIHI